MMALLEFAKPIAVSTIGFPNQQYPMIEAVGVCETMMANAQAFACKNRFVPWNTVLRPLSFQ